MAALISENFKFVSLFFKSKDVMIFNGLIALGTVASQEVYSVFAFNCPCSPERNYLYGMAAIGVPALALFLIGIMLIKNTWNLISECRIRACKKLSGTAAFALLGSIMGRAMVAPVTWSVISLLRGEPYVCALSEFVNTSSLKNFPEGYGPHTLAGFPCNTVPQEVAPFKESIERQLKYESQLLGWLLVGSIAVGVFLMQCLKHCCSPLGRQQEAYWLQYRSNEKALFQRTAEIHAKVLAAENVKQFFGFVALDENDKAQLREYQASNAIPSSKWSQITGVYLYRENKGLPLYSRLHKWVKGMMEDRADVNGKEQDQFLL
ncbi:calcium homeostasis modulator protein 2.1 [Amia ocellicauda]|uniref:calcium homeostasis modulator protein 2.1 n=1 Tax=Amia ocellicauda TaxID=2972642 RepID=UPI003464BFB6|nr:CAHM2 protein [Amia calva]